jgi:hypothetical protein
MPPDSPANASGDSPKTSAKTKSERNPIPGHSFFIQNLKGESLTA